MAKFVPPQGGHRKELAAHLNDLARIRDEQAAADAAKSTPEALAAAKAAELAAKDKKKTDAKDRGATKGTPMLNQYESAEILAQQMKGNKCPTCGLPKESGYESPTGQCAECDKEDFAKGRFPATMAGVLSEEPLSPYQVNERRYIFEHSTGAHAGTLHKEVCKSCKSMIEEHDAKYFPDRDNGRTGPKHLHDISRGGTWKEHCPKCLQILHNHNLKRVDNEGTEYGYHEVRQFEGADCPACQGLI